MDKCIWKYDEQDGSWDTSCEGGIYDTTCMTKKEAIEEWNKLNKRCSDCQSFKNSFGHYPEVCPECSGEFKPLTQQEREILKNEN